MKECVNMKESRCSLSITPSLTRKLFNMAQAIGDDVINLTLGDPDLFPPEKIRKAACEAIMAGKTRYSANAGLQAVRDAYAGFFERERGIQISSQKNIITTVGGMEALFLTFASLVDAGDEVIILEPYYVNYAQMINMCGGVAVPVDRYGKRTQEVIRLIQAAITEKTIGIVLNSPCNPTGDILPGEILDAVAEMACAHDLFVISDEVYNSLVYDGKLSESIYTRPGMAERTIIIDSCSKRFAMTGWRVGFAIGPEALIANMTKMQENVAACAPLPSQYAAIQAYSGDFDYSYIQKEYQKRKDFLVSELHNIPKIRFQEPEATFYCFVDVSETGMDAETFAYQLLEKQHVAVVPGVAYGEHYANYIRIAFTLDQNKLAEAMRRMKVFCEGLQ